MKLKKRLLITFLCVALIPTLTVAVVSTIIAKGAIQEQVFSKLVAVRDTKKAQVDNYFIERKSDLNSLAVNVADLLDFSSKQRLIDSAHQLDHSFNNMITSKGYYDLFLIDEQGNIFYSAFKESDYQSNLITGPYKDSNLATLFNIVEHNPTFAMTDFRPYAPSNGAPAAFIAQPIDTEQGRIVVALQLSIESLNGVMQSRHGMGETGESYLIGEDKLMRSDSYLDPTGHSISASFAGNVKNNGVDTEAAQLALGGETGTKIILDYNGNLVLSAFTPLQVHGLQWALLAEIDVSEALQVISSLYGDILMLVVTCMLLTIFVAVWVSNSILKPLGGEPKEMQFISESIADGDLTVSFEARDDNNTVYAAMKKMTHQLLIIMQEMTLGSNNLAQVAEKTSALSLHSSESLNHQQSSIEMVVAATEEMSASINEVAENASQTANSARAAQQSSDNAKHKLIETMSALNALDTQLSDASAVLENLGKETADIGSVLEVISGIADQTNLLALNAAIEAARAGEQGRGFAVVADEVRSLASKSQKSTESINNMITRLQSASQNALQAMSESRSICDETINGAQDTEGIITLMNGDIDNISEMTILIASAVEEQSSVSKDITKSMTTIHDTAAGNLSNAQDVSNASQEINVIAGSLNTLTLKFKV